MFRFLKILFFTLLFFYLSFGSYLYINQKSLIYFPSKQDFYECEAFNDYQKLNFNGTKFYYKENDLKNIIVFYHGNAGSTCDRAYMKKYFENLDYSLLFVEYAGYSDDNYKPSINLLYTDVSNVKTFIQSKNYNNIVVFSRSIGTGLATYHSKIGKVDKIILTTPFTSFEELVFLKYPFYPIRYLLTEKYDNVLNLENYRNSLLIIHGDKDEVVPYKLGEKLFENIKSVNREFVTISGKGHNDLEDDEIFYTKIIEFIKK